MKISELTLAELRHEAAERTLDLARIKASAVSGLSDTGEARMAQAQQRADEYALIVAWAEAENDEDVPLPVADCLEPYGHDPHVWQSKSGAQRCLGGV